MAKKSTLQVKGTTIRTLQHNGIDYICITDIARQKNPAEPKDVLNVALFGMTALEWHDAHPDLKGNIRDYAGVNELICLSNMESLNAVLINEGLSQRERLVKLNRIAIQQMRILEDTNRKLLK